LLVRRDGSASLNPDLLCLCRGEVLDEISPFGGVLEHPEQIARYHLCTTICGIDVGEAEESEVLPWLEVGKVMDEEVGDERRLVMQVASWRAGEHRIERRLEGGLEHVALTAVGQAGTVDDGTKRLPRRLHLRRVPWLLARPPGLVFRRTGLTEKEVFNPVGAGPTGRCATLHADAPWRLSGLPPNRLGRRLHIRPGFRRGREVDAS